MKTVLAGCLACVSMMGAPGVLASGGPPGSDGPSPVVPPASVELAIPLVTQLPATYCAPYDPDSTIPAGRSQVSTLQVTGPIQFATNARTTSDGVCFTINNAPVLASSGTERIQVASGSRTIPNYIIDISVYIEDFKPATSVWVSPKYMIVGVGYAPPGPASSINYSNTSTFGTTTTVSNTQTSSRTTTNAFSVSDSGPTPIPGLSMSGSFTSTTSKTNTQSTTASDALTLSTTITNSNIIPGTTDAYAPVSHANDYIWLWLNPMILYYASPPTNTVMWNGWAYNTDDIQGFDILGVPVYVLQWIANPVGPNPAPSLTSYLKRSWAAGQPWPAGETAEITPADAATILQADPFAANPNYSIPRQTASTADGRYTFMTMQSTDGGGGGAMTDFQYSQASVGGQPLKTGFSVSSSRQTTSTLSNSQSYSQTVTISGSSSATAILQVSATLTDSRTLTLTNMTSNSNSVTNTLAANATLFGPPCVVMSGACSPLYAAPQPAEFDVYIDNIYGTYLFNPLY
jgi:hypothetical protein